MKARNILIPSAAFTLLLGGVTFAAPNSPQIQAESIPMPLAKSIDTDIQTLVGGGADTIAPKSDQNWLGKSLNLVWTATREGAEAVQENFNAFICNAEQLAWNTTTELGKAKGTANYTVQQITPDITQISWRDNPQESNLGWVWTLDANTGKAYGVVINSQPYENLAIEGDFAVLPIPVPEEKEFSCPKTP